MPKAERGTPKDIANRAKSKGLQKLKFFCQMCAKQCRDENGFKCHVTSDSHLRQMKIFGENSRGMMDSFSKEFLNAYLETLRRRHGTKRCNANNVYQEVISDKGHVHMNATKWLTLSEFVQFLGKMGRCTVDETERGWYVTYIERDPILLQRQEDTKRRKEAEKVEEDRYVVRMERQRVEAAKALDKIGGTVHVEASKMEREEGEAVAIKLSGVGKKGKKLGVKVGKSVLGTDSDEDRSEDCQTISKDRGIKHSTNEGTDVAEKRSKKRRRDETVRHNKEISSKQESNITASKEYKNIRTENWLHEGILVKIRTKKLAKGKYYKYKGVVDKVIDKFTAQVEILDSGPDERDGGDIVRLDQDDLETVVPKLGRKVRILNGVGRGCLAELVSLDKEKFCAVLKLQEDGQIVENVEYEDFSKVI